MMSDEPILGIDLGTTNSAMAILEGGDPEILTNADGERVTPSVVAFTETGERLVGAQAKNQAVQNPENTVESIKRHMGDEDYTVELQGREYTPEEVSGMILRKMKNDAESKLGNEINRAVITVPAYFNDKQRTATKDAGEIAGLTVERLVNEPTAAAMAYGLDSAEDTENVLIYDLGGGTFDVSILEIVGGVYDVIATSGNQELGGDDWDNEIINWLLERFEQEHGIDLQDDLQALQRVRDAAEEAKIALSTREQTTINLPFITAGESGDPVHLEETLTREDFEEMTEHLVEETVPPIETALDEAGYTINEIDSVLLVGGSTRMPMVQEQVQKATKSINPDEVVSLGAAVQGGILTGEMDETVLLDVTPLSLGIEVKGGLFQPLIENNTTIPVTESKVFTTASDNQTSVQIRVYQGEREIAEENDFLDEFTLTGIPPAPAGTPQIKVEFAIDENGIVNVSAEDQATGTAESITIEGGTGLSDREIEAMRKEAEKHSEEDKEKRKRIEARNGLQSLVQQSNRLLTQYDLDQVSSTDTDELKEAKEAAEALLETDEGAVEMSELQEMISDLETLVMTVGEQMHDSDEVDEIPAQRKSDAVFNEE